MGDGRIPGYKDCRDCGNCIQQVVNPMYCSAPQLVDVIDSSMGSPANTIAACQETRDFKFACGHEARWFVPKP